MIEFIVEYQQEISMAYILSVMLVWLVAFRNSEDDNPYDLPWYGILAVVLWPVTATIALMHWVGSTAIDTWERLMIRNKYGK
jgi:hypothetical protein